MYKESIFYKIHLTKIVHYLYWASVFFTGTIPLATGVLYAWLSTVILAVNARFLKIED